MIFLLINDKVVIDRIMDGQEKFVQHQYLVTMKLRLFYIFSSKAYHELN